MNVLITIKQLFLQSGTLQVYYDASILLLNNKIIRLPSKIILPKNYFKHKNLIKKASTSGNKLDVNSFYVFFRTWFSERLPFIFLLRVATDFYFPL